MRLNVTFRCSLPVDKSAHPIGEELATYLGSRLTEGGVTISDIDNYEDFAWSLDTTVNGKKLFICVGHVGDGDYEWLLQIDEYTTRFWDIFRKHVALAEREQLAPRIHAILASDPHFSEIRWHVGDFAEERYTATPNENAE